MYLDISHVLAPEQTERLRESAQAPLGLTALVRRLFRKPTTPQAPVAWVARHSEAREVDQLAA